MAAQVTEKISFDRNLLGREQPFPHRSQLFFQWRTRSGIIRIDAYPCFQCAGENDSSFQAAAHAAQDLGTVKHRVINAPISQRPEPSLKEQLLHLHFLLGVEKTERFHFGVRLVCLE